MRNRYNHIEQGSITYKVMCAVIFLLFSFLWLYEFQADILAIAQHVLSHGVTQYNRSVGAILITIVLYILQRFIANVTKMSCRFYALTYFPSMLILAVVSDINPDIDQHFSFGAWVWVFPFLLMVWGVFVWFVRQTMSLGLDDGQYGSVSSVRKLWLNMLQMIIMMLGVTLVGNTNSVFHYSAHVEVALMNGDVDEALMVGNRALETNERLTLLRAFALSKKGKLADSFFNYPVKGTSETLLPMQVKPQLLPEDSIWKFQGARSSKTVSSEFYYERMERDTLGTSAMIDYRLCGYLINRDLNSFVRVLPKYYEVSDTLPLPRHYKEALVLYQHLTAHPAIVYHDPVLAEDWNNFQQLKLKYSKESERKYRIFDNYQKSYWYYYFYRN
jgi:hypothetical protein